MLSNNNWVVVKNKGRPEEKEFLDLYFDLCHGCSTHRRYHGDKPPRHTECEECQALHKKWQRHEELKAVLAE